MSEHRVSLFDIDAALLQLCEARDEVAESLTVALTVEDKSHFESELVQIDKAIAEWTESQLDKADSLARTLRMCDANANQAMVEADRYYGWAKNWKARKDSINRLLVAAIERRGGEPLRGRSSVIRAQTNGGLQTLTVQGWDSEKREWNGSSLLLPSEYRAWIARIPMHVAVDDNATMSDPRIEWIKREPDNAAIRAELAKPCQACEGTGYMKHDRAVELVMQLPDGGCVNQTCETCGGTGHRGVPGCKLEGRGKHIVVR